MSTVSDVIDEVRLYLQDDEDTFSDANILTVVKRAIIRADAVLYRNNVEFFQKEYSFNTVAGQAAYSLPSDFGTPLMLSRDDSDVELNFVTKREWRRIVSQSECSNWLLKSDPDDSYTQKVFIGGTPQSVVALTLDYYPKTDTDSLTTSSDMPYGGKLDSVIADYAKILLQNVDEMDPFFDVKLLTDFENNILSYYAAQNPQTISRQGWNSGTAGN